MLTIHRSSLKENKESAKNMVDILNIFSLASSLKINWGKSTPYWQSSLSNKPTWLDNYQWKWVHDGEFFDLMGTTFGLSLDVKDVDEFLMSTIHKNFFNGGLNICHYQGGD